MSPRLSSRIGNTPTHRLLEKFKSKIPYLIQVPKRRIVRFGVGAGDRQFMQDSFFFSFRVNECFLTVNERHLQIQSRNIINKKHKENNTIEK
jgi:hypothetical protein